MSKRALRRALRRVHRGQVLFKKPRRSKYLTRCFREKNRIMNPVQTAYSWLLSEGHIAIDGKSVALTEKGKALRARLQKEG